MKRNAKKHTTIKSRGSARKSKAAPAASSRAQRRGKRPGGGWRESDAHFDAKGRLVIHSRKIARQINEVVEGNTPLIVINPVNPVRPPRPPNPVDEMCGCIDLRLAIKRIRAIDARRLGTLRPVRPA